MKKYVLIIAVVVLVGLTALLLFFGGSPTDQGKISKTTPKPTYHAAASESALASPDASVLSTLEATTAPADIVTAADIPVPSAEDISEAVFSTKEDAELKFLTTDQKKELDAAAVVKHTPEAISEQAYTVTWKDTAITDKVPSLPESVPLYLLARPTDTRVFAVLKDIAAALGIKGSVVRMDNQNYAVANISTGDYYLFFDLFHLTFDAKGLAIAIATSGADGIKEVLTAAGLLGFPNTVTEATDDNTGATWYRFTPQLPLPVVSLDPPTDDSVFTPGKTGTVDVAIDSEGNISEINSSFPNITEKSTATIAPADEIATRITTGSFRLGDVELQYPGAMPLEDKRKFYDLQNADTITIADAEVSKLECGYLSETEATVQALLSPVCIVHGKGRVESYSVLFRTVVSVTK